MKTQLNKGFTLVELMVVVAIIGLLSAVAVPNFKKYQAKAKTSEAKLQLSAIYMSMQSFSLDYNNYGTCLNQMGYDPSRENTSRYYAVGFSAANDAANQEISNNQGGPAACGATAGVVHALTDTVPADMTKSYFAYDPGKKVNNKIAVSSWLSEAGAATVTGANDQFLAAAVGVVSGDNGTQTLSDVWTINEKKELKQARTGF